MWTYHQRTGSLLDAKKHWIAKGFAGNGAGKNNPEMENVPRVGPLPKGKYTILKPAYFHQRLGPVVLNLEPFPENEMYGRSLFRIHGWSLVDPENSSKGCICVTRAIRQLLEESDDNILKVVK